MHIQTNQTENTSYAAQPGFGGMNQVSSGPAGLLYSLSNQLIQIYNQLQNLYGQVANAETTVQQDTIISGAAAQTDAAIQQSNSIYFQMGEALFGGVATAGSTAFEAYKGGDLDNQMGDLEKEKAPLEQLDKLQKKEDLNFGRTIGTREPTGTEITARVNELKSGKYANTGTHDPEVINQKAINEMSDEDYTQFKKDLDNKLMDKEKRINTLQSRRQVQQSSYNSYSQIGTQMANSAFKGGEATTTARAGQAQAIQQTSSGVQQMAGSTADSSRGSIGQDYAKVSDAIAAARQGAQAYAQT